MAVARACTTAAGAHGDPDPGSRGRLRAPELAPTGGMRPPRGVPAGGELDPDRARAARADDRQPMDRLERQRVSAAVGEPHVDIDPVERRVGRPEDGACRRDRDVATVATDEAGRGAAVERDRQREARLVDSNRRAKPRPRTRRRAVLREGVPGDRVLAAVDGHGPRDAAELAASVRGMRRREIERDLGLDEIGRGEPDLEIEEWARVGKAEERAREADVEDAVRICADVEPPASTETEALACEEEEAPTRGNQEEPAAPSRVARDASRAPRRDEQQRTRVVWPRGRARRGRDGFWGLSDERRQHVAARGDEPAPPGPGPAEDDAELHLHGVDASAEGRERPDDGAGIVAVAGREELDEVLTVTRGVAGADRRVDPARRARRDEGAEGAGGEAR